MLYVTPAQNSAKKYKYSSYLLPSSNISFKMEHQRYDTFSLRINDDNLYSFYENLWLFQLPGLLIMVIELFFIFSRPPVQIPSLARNWTWIYLYLNINWSIACEILKTGIPCDKAKKKNSTVWSSDVVHLYSKMTVNGKVKELLLGRYCLRCCFLDSSCSGIVPITDWSCLSLCLSMNKEVKSWRAYVTSLLRGPHAVI